MMDIQWVGIKTLCFFLVIKCALVRDFRDCMNFCILLFLVKKDGKKWGI